MKIGEFEVIRTILDYSNKKFYKATRNDRVHFLKLIQIKNKDKMFGFEFNFLEKWQTEAHFIKGLNHPNVVKFISQFNDNINFYKQLYECQILAFEYCDSSLHDIIYRFKTSLSEKEIQDIIGQISLALRYLNERKIIHGDISASSVLIKNRNHVIKLIKFCDFGSSIREGEVYKFLNNNNRIYLAPELLKNEQYKCTSKADVYSFGCVIYELVKLKHPFTQNDNLLNDKLGEKYDIVKDPRVSHRMWRLVIKMLKNDKKRYSVLELFEKKIIIYSCLSFIGNFNLNLNDTDNNLTYKNQQTSLLNELSRKKSKRWMSELMSLSDITSSIIPEFNDDTKNSNTAKDNIQILKDNIIIPKHETPAFRNNSPTPNENKPELMINERSTINNIQVFKDNARETKHNSQTSNDGNPASNDNGKAFEDDNPISNDKSPESKHDFHESKDNSPRSNDKSATSDDNSPVPNDKSPATNDDIQQVFLPDSNEQALATTNKQNLPHPKPFTRKIKRSSINCENIKNAVSKYEELDEKAKEASKTLIQCKKDENATKSRFRINSSNKLYRSRSFLVSSSKESVEEKNVPTEIVRPNYDVIEQNQQPSNESGTNIYRDVLLREKRQPKNRTDIMNASHFNEKGIEFLKKNKLNQAIINFDKAIELDGKQDSYYFNKAIALSRWDKFKEALKWYDKALLLNTKSANNYFYKAKCLVKLKEFGEAKFCIDKAIQIDSNNYEFCLFKSKLLMQMNQQNESHRWALYALKLDENNPECNYIVGCRNLEKGDLDDAVYFFKNACNLERNHYYFAHCATILFQQKKYQEALEYINEAVDIDKNNLNYMDWQNHILYHCEQTRTK